MPRKGKTRKELEAPAMQALRTEMLGDTKRRLKGDKSPSLENKLRKSKSFKERRKKEYTGK